MNEDGLYLSGQLVADTEGLAMNYQSNDLTSPATLETSYSDSFTLPDSDMVRRLTKNAEQIDAAGPDLYRSLPAQVVESGEVVFDGFAEFKDFSGGWSMTLFDEKLSIYDRLGRSLRTLNLSRLDHPWTLVAINSMADVTAGVCYPLADYGLLQSGSQPLDSLFPAVFVKTLIDQALQEEGYTLVGDLREDEVYKRLLVAFTESEPTSNDQQWQDDRFARVTLNGPTDSARRGALGGSEFFNRIQPYDIDNIDTFYQGKLKPFNTTTHEYIVPDAMNLLVEASQIFKAQSNLDTIEAVLWVEKNGIEIGQARFEESGLYNSLYLRTDRLTLSQVVKCQPGDRVSLHFRCGRMTKLGAYRFDIYNDPENSLASFTPQLATSFGDTWRVVRNLPDLPVLDLIKSVAQLLSGVWMVDKRRKQVSFTRLSDIVSGKYGTTEWSSRIDTSQEPHLTPRLDPYAQNNLLRWTETDESKKAAVPLSGQTLNYGDGLISVNATNLDLATTLFTLPFAASTDSAQALPGYGSPPLIKLRTVSGTGSNLSINNQESPPRLLLASLGDAYTATSSRLLEDDQTTEQVSVKLRPCWFGVRPYPVVLTEPAVCLNFNTPLIRQGEEGLIARYYGGLQRVLRRVRVLSLSAYLNAVDVATLDFRKRVHLQEVGVGALAISDSFWYLNKVSNYVPGHACQITLIGFLPPAPSQTPT